MPAGLLSPVGTPIALSLGVGADEGGLPPHQLPASSDSAPPEVLLSSRGKLLQCGLSQLYEVSEVRGVYHRYLASQSLLGIR